MQQCKPRYVVYCSSTLHCYSMLNNVRKVSELVLSRTLCFVFKQSLYFVPCLLTVWLLIDGFKVDSGVILVCDIWPILRPETYLAKLT
jgi:hypothetical protein